MKWRRFSWPWCDGDVRGGKKPPKTVNIFMGFFFMVNLCLGTGFLGIPFSFFYTGYLAAIPTLLVIGIVSWLNSLWLLEVMARAQALETMEKSRERTSSDSDTTDSEMDGKKLNSTFTMDRQHPEFEITLKRKFEPVELCEIFVGRWFKYAYLVVVVIYCFLASWSFSTVAGSAWATNIPYNFGAMNICESDAFQHRVLPAGGCLYSYYFSVFLFGVIVVTLSLLDLKEQALVQLFLGSLRFITVGIIIIYSIVRLAEGGNVCENSALELVNSTTSRVHVISLQDIVVKFDPKGWLTGIPVYTYAFLLHLGISSLTHPIKQKKHLNWLMTAMFLAALLCYMSLGVVVPLWFKATTLETITLNWGEFTGPGNSVQLRALAYYLVLFPSLDVMSAYPLNIHCAVNNLYMILTGRDTSKKPKLKFDWLLRFFLRLIAAVLPLLAALGVANLIYVLKYAGLVGFGICFIFPTILQLRSIYVCVQKFAGVHVSLSGSHSKSHDKSRDGRSPSPEHELKGAIGGIDQEKSPLLSIMELEGKDKRHLYLTPYSNVVLSHPIFVSVVGIVGLVLFILAAASLFVHPHKIPCAYRQEL